MTKQTTGILRVGTSGIVVPGSKETFPPEFRLSSRLNYYSTLFNTLEINSTFSKIPKLSTFQKWALEVPEEFQFTVKLWKEITHIKGLHVELENVDTFFDAAAAIRNKKGCLLIQFPGSITNEYFEQVAQILLRILQKDHESLWRKAIEFRSATWYAKDTYELLKKHGISLVFHDMPKSNSLLLDIPAKFAYYRFHGPKGDYRGSYASDLLWEQAKKIRNLLNNGKDVYAYFNNTMGSAFENANELKRMVENRG